jgi:GNAT superfamily N-acetyltransferase
MNRDELLLACFGRDDLPQGARIFEELDEERRNVLSHVDLSYRRVVVRRSTAPGPGVTESSVMLSIASVANVCTDPGHRGQGYASRQIELAHEEARTHPSVRFAALFAGPDEAGFFARLGYVPVEGGPDGFMVCQLADEEWPAGRVRYEGEVVTKIPVCEQPLKGEKEAKS